MSTDYDYGKINAGMSGSTSIQFDQWEWTPQPDITAYEIAQVLPILLHSGPFGLSASGLSVELQRHFRKRERHE